MSRSTISFVSGPSGDSCRAWFYLPDRAGPHPAIVMAHGLGAIKEMRLDAFADSFVECGYACLVFDYRHFGDSDGEPRQLMSIERQLQDWTSAIDFARRHSALRSDRIVLWGSSFAGGHVIRTAAREQAVAAVIAQCPFTSGLNSMMAMDLKTVLKLAVTGVTDTVGASLGFAPISIPTVGSQGSLALVNAPNALLQYLSLVPDSVCFENRILARAALSIAFYVPGRSAPHIKCPSLFCVSQGDVIAPAAATLRYARMAPRGETKLYPFGHFDPYLGTGFECVIRDQVAFLKRHIPVAETA